MLALAIVLELAAATGAVPPAARYTAKEAIAAEWERQPPKLGDAERAALGGEERARLERSLMRIGAPGAPPLLPEELAKPTVERWLTKAKAARTPRERFDALYFLNRLKSRDALLALEGLGADDAATWPRHLHLEGQLAAARLSGAELTPSLQRFYDALQAAGKVDPRRAVAAQLRLALVGKGKPTPVANPSEALLLGLFDAWSRAPWAVRQTGLAELRVVGGAVLLGFLGVTTPVKLDLGVRQRLFASLPEEGFTPASDGERQLVTLLVETALHRGERDEAHALDRLAALEGLGRVRGVAEVAARAQELAKSERDPLAQAALLPSLRALAPAAADPLRDALLDGSQPDAVARAAALGDLAAAPADLDKLTRVVWNDTTLESQQALIESYDRWKLPAERQIGELRRWLDHPDWACRYLAYLALAKLDPKSPWPAAPLASREQEHILELAGRLATAARPVRLRLTFAGRPPIVLRLDPALAPINVANLVRLAKRRFFDGHRVPRVVPDFVVQLGSPLDTMDGGPGYSVRCEDSLEWFGPGSIGMALSGKDTGGSQLFFTTNATPHLTGKYTRVGEVEDLDHALPLLDALPLGTKIVRVESL